MKQAFGCVKSGIVVLGALGCVLAGCGVEPVTAPSRAEIVAALSAPSPGGWMCGLRVTGDGAPRAYMVTRVDPLVYDADSAYKVGPIYDRLCFSPNYESSWQPSCAGWSGFTYHQPGYYGTRFWIATGKDSLWGSLACTDAGVIPDPTACRDTLFFPTNEIYWPQEIVSEQGTYNIPLKHKGGWSGTLHKVEVTADSVILCAIELKGPSRLKIELGRMARAR